jgi:transcriptional antiterminator NusG
MARAKSSRRVIAGTGESELTTDQAQRSENSTSPSGEEPIAAQLPPDDAAPPSLAGENSAEEKSERSFPAEDHAANHSDEPAVDDVDDDDEPEESTSSEPLELIEELIRDEEVNLRWYILKVASNRENSIADALRRRVKVEGMDRFFGEIIVPTEDVVEYKNGKKRTVKRKLYPGYICVQMHVNDDTWFLVRDTPGIGDFTGGGGHPTPMLDHDVQKILPKAQGSTEEPAKVGIPFKLKERVRIKEGTFENFEGDVEGIDEANGRVTVVINIFDRPTPVEIDHWQLEAM